MNYREAVIEIAENLREGYEKEGYNYFNKGIERLRKSITKSYFNSRDNKDTRNKVDTVIGAVTSEIFGNLNVTGEYDFRVVDNALMQLRQRGLLDNSN